MKDAFGVEQVSKGLPSALRGNKGAATLMAHMDRLDGPGERRAIKGLRKVGDPRKRGKVGIKLIEAPLGKESAYILARRGRNEIGRKVSSRIAENHRIDNYNAATTGPKKIQYANDIDDIKTAQGMRDWEKKRGFEAVNVEKGLPSFLGFASKESKAVQAVHTRAATRRAVNAMRPPQPGAPASAAAPTGAGVPGYGVKPPKPSKTAKVKKPPEEKQKTGASAFIDRNRTGLIWGGGGIAAGGLGGYALSRDR